MERFFLNVGSIICHQLKERSFFINGKPLPVCARCTGIYIGIFSAYLYLIVRKRLNGNKPISIFFGVLISLGITMLAFDGITSYLLIRQTNNIIRLITGIFLGCGLPVLFILLYNFDPSGENNKAIIKKNYEYLFIFLISLTLSCLILVNNSITWFVLCIIICVAIPASPLSFVAVVCKRIVKSKGFCK